MAYPRIASLKNADQFLDRLAALGVTLPFDRQLEAPGSSVLGQPLTRGGVTVGNRFCILPMEGWDCTLDGRPTDLTRRRWQHFGASGAKLIWGGEAFAVRHDGRANPNQLSNGPHAEADLTELRRILVEAHESATESSRDLFIGLQLTHSGRYARPNPGGAWEPMTAYRHPVLDLRFPATVQPHLFTDDELDALVGDFVDAARVAQRAGFDFVDIKHCHGYLGHELLSATTRPGKYGGTDGRATFVRTITAAIRQHVPGMQCGVRLSAFDAVPYSKGAQGVGVPETEALGYRSAFGLMTDPAQPPSLDDARAFLATLTEIGIDWVCVTAGSPYYNPHIQRPALFPPSDGYDPPEDPLVGVARQIGAVSVLKRAFPALAIVGSGYSYLQEWLPHVGQAAVRDGHTDFVGLGRMVLSYPEMPRDVLAGRPLKRAMICRTFSDCTSAPRNGLVSGCFPLDPFYKGHPQAAQLKALKETLA